MEEKRIGCGIKTQGNKEEWDRVDQDRIIQNILHTLQVLHSSISETGLPQDGGSLLTLSASHGVLTAGQRVFHIGVGDENDQAWVCQRDRGGLQGPKDMVDHGGHKFIVSSAFENICQNMLSRDRGNLNLFSHYLQSMSKACPSLPRTDTN